MVRRSLKPSSPTDDRSQGKLEMETDARKFVHTSQKDLTTRSSEMSPKSDNTYSSSHSSEIYVTRRASLVTFIRCGTGVEGSVRRSCEPDQKQKLHGSTSIANSTPMVLRSRVLRSQHHNHSGTLEEEDVSCTRSMPDSPFQRSSVWKENDEFSVQNKHGNDCGKQILQLHSPYDQHQSKENLIVEVVSRPSILGHFLSHIVSVIQISCAVVMFLPRTTILKVFSLFIECSKNTDGTTKHSVLPNLLRQWFESINVAKIPRNVDSTVSSRTSTRRRHCNCLFLLFIFLLLVLIGVFCASSSLQNCAAILAPNVIEKLSFRFPLFSRVKVNGTEIIIQGINKTDINTSDAALPGVPEMEKQVHSLFHILAANYTSAAEAEQNRTLFSFQSHVSDLVKVLVSKEMDVERDLWSVQMDSVKTATDDSHSSLIAEQRRHLSFIAEIRKSLEVLTSKSQELSEDISLLKANLASQKVIENIDRNQEVLNLGEHVNKVSLELVQLKEKYDGLATEMSHLSTHEPTAELIRTRIREYFKEVVDTGVIDSSGAADGAFQSWLGSSFATRVDLEKTLATLAANITKQINEKVMEMKDEASNIAKAVPDGFPCILCTPGQLTEGDVLKLIHEQLGMYDADKTGKVDYALESAGGSIISERCSETYQEQTGQATIFGIPIWYTYNSPRAIIQPGVQPGECWALDGSRGHVVIQLSRQIFITEVSIEHIPMVLAPSGTIDSAPKDFEIWGLESETDRNGKFLGSFTYDGAGTTIQSFQLQNSTGMSFKFVQLKILSNHGHELYTCIYRFRVHGCRDLNWT